MAALRSSFATLIASPIAIIAGGSDEPISPTAARPAWTLTAILILQSHCRPSRSLRSEIALSIAPAACRDCWAACVGVAFEAEQRADAVELEVAERAVRRADRVA